MCGGTPGPRLARVTAAGHVLGSWRGSRRRRGLHALEQARECRDLGGARTPALQSLACGLDVLQRGRIRNLIQLALEALLACVSDSAMQ